MTDRELLELAAKAAGMRLTTNGVLNVGDWEWLDAMGGGLYRNNANGTQLRWNPITDDGDALRLAVKLNITVQFPWDDALRFIKETHCWTAADEPVEEEHGRGDEYDPYAATRRAIVRAAAEIGKNL